MSIAGRVLSGLSLGLAAVLLVGGLPAAGETELERVSRASPFDDCAIQLLKGERNFLNAEVEPWLAVNPHHPSNLIGVYQQDRFEGGGSRGLMTGVSHDRGETWHRTFAHFSRCAGGNAHNNGNFERASDPWVSISPNGVAHQIALAFDFFDPNQAILVSNSTDEGDSWSEPIPLIFDTDPTLVDDKETITADPHHSNLVYAVWDRLVFTNAKQTTLVRGPTLFSRSTDAGKHWEPARVIFDPGVDAQTISNQIVVLPNGDLVNLLVRILEDNENAPKLGDIDVVVIRSTDKGVTWSGPIVVNTLQSVGVTDPKTGEPVRTGDIVPAIAVSPNGTLHVVWQDARFSGGKRDGIAFSSSHDGGRTWSAPKQINKVKRTQAFTAAIAAGEDAIAVTYYDFRHDTANKALLLTDEWQTVSENGGASFHERHVAGPFDMRTAPEAGGFFVGDYEGLGHIGEDFLPFFVKTNSGNRHNRTDVFASIVEDEDEDEGEGPEADAVPRSVHELLDAHRESGQKAVQRLLGVSGD